MQRPRNIFGFGLDDLLLIHHLLVAIELDLIMADLGVICLFDLLLGWSVSIVGLLRLLGLMAWMEGFLLLLVGLLFLVSLQSMSHGLRFHTSFLIYVKSN